MNGSALILILGVCTAACPAAEKPAVSTVALPHDMIRNGSAKLMTMGEASRRRAALTLLEGHRRDWEQQVLTALDAYLGDHKTTGHKQLPALRAWEAIEVARFLVMRQVIPRLKKVVIKDAEHNNLVRPAMRTLSRLGVDDEYWLKCLSTTSKNGRDYVACAALCEIWDSKSPKIQAAIKNARKEIAARKNVDYSIGLPHTLHAISIVKTLDKAYTASPPPQKLKLIERALRKGEDAFGGRWLKDYFGRSLYDYGYLHVRWGSRRLLELGTQQPAVVARHIASLPYCDTKELKVEKEKREAYRQYLLQWLGAKMKERVRVLMK